MSIELHIERLVIDAAVLGGERVADVRAAIERELAQLLTQPDTADALNSLGTLDALPSLQLAPAHPPRDTFGGRIAAAVGQRLGVAPVSHTGVTDGRRRWHHG